VIVSTILVVVVIGTGAVVVGVVVSEQYVDVESVSVRVGSVCHVCDGSWYVATS